MSDYTSEEIEEVYRKQREYEQAVKMSSNPEYKRQREAMDLLGKEYEKIAEAAKAINQTGNKQPNLLKS